VVVPACLGWGDLQLCPFAGQGTNGNTMHIIRLGPAIQHLAEPQLEMEMVGARHVEQWDSQVEPCRPSNSVKVKAAEGSGDSNRTTR
jgi:hypothetical protein